MDTSLYKSNESNYVIYYADKYVSFNLNDINSQHLDIKWSLMKGNPRVIKPYLEASTNNNKFLTLKFEFKGKEYLDYAANLGKMAYPIFLWYEISDPQEKFISVLDMENCNNVKIDFMMKNVNVPCDDVVLAFKSINDHEFPMNKPYLYNGIINISI